MRPLRAPGSPHTCGPRGKSSVSIKRCDSDGAMNDASTQKERSTADYSAVRSQGPGNIPAPNIEQNIYVCPNLELAELDECSISGLRPADLSTTDNDMKKCNPSAVATC